ncbi:hypothetical protein Moror_4881 [Moniliophthora roreri MCA 2997]|uniref:Uncharacterized protein n=2 Tax=Moniliophthora roreri TaxID=221103 RepID=V2WSG9_MONRO|nr:hypothetical protein Moror_4881 [Moniliophthora roreri MCA 2997]KAI3605422.1 hypothetical protein WG66_005954 [Moniliophthora roreri]
MTSLTEWAQSNLNALFEHSGEQEDTFSSQFNATFSPNASILMNHETISVDEYKKRISQTLVTASSSVEWKDVLEDTEAGVVAGFLVITRTMKFRIRAAPAKNYTYITISAKIAQEGGERRIVNLVHTFTSKAAPIHIQPVQGGEA